MLRVGVCIVLLTFILILTTSHLIALVHAEPTMITLISDEYEKTPKECEIISYTLLSEEAGFGIEFTIPSDKFRVESIIILGCYSYASSDTHRRKFKIEIRDGNKRLIKKMSYTYSDYFEEYYAPEYEHIPSGVVKFVKIPISATITTSKFYVVIYPNSKDKDNALWIATDSYSYSDSNETIYPSESHTYSFERGDIVSKEKFNVVVRVEGYPIYTVRVRSNLPSGLSVAVRNETSTFVLRGGEELVMDAYNQSVLKVLEGVVYLDNTTRYECVTCSQVVSGRREVFFSFRKQYYVSVKSAYGEVKGEGWYNEGSYATISVYPDVVYGDNVRYVFVGWQPIGGHEPSITIRVDRPLSVTALWAVEYKVVVESEYGTASLVYNGEKVSGQKVEVWVRQNDKVTVSITPLSYGLLIRKVFVEWVDQWGNKYRDAGINIEVTEPVILTAKWRDDYTLLMLLIVAIIMGVMMIYIVMGGTPPHKRYLEKLEELYREGKVSKETYEKLKEEYQKKLRGEY